MPNASAEDGIIEGIELPQKRFVLGVQWHPEELFSSDPAMLKLFKEFVAACH
jgi:putative glutamine amidotransferase